MHVLVTGANGFVGKTLVPMLEKEGIRVTAAGTEEHNQDFANWCQFDLCDKKSVDDLVRKTMPSHVVHLAAVSHVPTSFAKPELTWLTNVMGTMLLLEAFKVHSPNTFFCLISSSEVYGESFKRGEVVTETTELAPMNPYAASKVAAELVAQQYVRQGLKGVILRPFNHIGPGQAKGFVTSAFASQIADFESSKLDDCVIKVGNLEAFREFLNVKDVSKAYVSILKASDSLTSGGIFNISSGQPVKIEEVLNRLLSLSSKHINVVQDINLLRPSEIEKACGSSKKLFNALGWKPSIDLTDSLQEVLNSWRVNR